MHVPRSMLGGAVVVAALGALVPAPSFAQRASWRVRFAATAELTFDDNPFLLTASRKPDLDQPGAADVASGRFTDMASGWDVIAAPGLELRLRGPGIGDEDLEVEVAAAVEANVLNSRRRHVETRLTVDQSTRRGRMRLRADLRPAYFSKNYLSDAIDGNADFEIDPAERRYDAGVSTELDTRLTYRHRLTTVALEVGVGYLNRGYRAPFPGRSRSGPLVAAGVALELSKHWSLDGDYSLGLLRGAATREVLILDETAFGQDFNGNGSATNLAARAFELVDRSRNEHQIDLTLQGEPSKDVTLEFAYGLRLRAFTSTQPFDVSDRGRHDTQHEIGAQAAIDLGKGLQLEIRARRSWQTTNRPADPGAAGDVADYTRSSGGAALRYRF